MGEALSYDWGGVEGRRTLEWNWGGVIMDSGGSDSQNQSRKSHQEAQKYKEI